MCLPPPGGIGVAEGQPHELGDVEDGQVVVFLELGGGFPLAGVQIGLAHRAGGNQALRPGLTSHPDHVLAAKVLDGFGGMVGVELRGGGRAVEKLDNPAFGLDKMTGYTRAEPPLWTLWLPVRVRAMVKAGDTLFAAGTPDVLDEKDPYAAFEGRKGASLVSVSAKDGKKLSEFPLSAPPVFDGMMAAGGRLLVALEDGSLLCMEKR